MIGDERDPELPPRDELAERIVLQHLAFYPSKLDGWDYLPLFVKDSNIRIFTSLKQCKAAHPDVPEVEFFQCWFEDQRKFSGEDEAVEMLGVILDTDLESARAWEEIESYPKHEEGKLKLSEYHHPFHWWVARLSRIRKARARIELAQRLAEKAWREPDVPANESEIAEIARELMPANRSVGADLPV